MEDASPSVTQVGPVQANERIEFLDVLRGFALFGVLLINLCWTGPGLSLTEAEQAALPTARLDTVFAVVGTFLVEGCIDARAQVMCSLPVST